MRKKVSVIGLGNIGLPTACLLASFGHDVLGVDTDHQVINRLQSKQIHLLEPNLQNLLIQAIETGSFKTSTQPAPADVHVIIVPTFLNTKREPDLQCVYQAVETLKPFLRPQDLVLIESTCPIGTTEKLACDLRSDCPQTFVAYCPERVLPGNILHELIHNDRVVGGVDDRSISAAVSFYQSFVKGEVLGTDAKTAEAVKLAENSYRDINIAYANELSMIADQMDLDIHKVIELANRHPRVAILNPGPGVGGYCIGPNSWFLASAAPHLAQLTVKARDVNLQKSKWVIQKIKEAIEQKKAHTIACLGLTYKANVADTRQSPALEIVKALEKEVHVLRVDPYVPGTELLDHALSLAPIIVSLVAHAEFSTIPPAYLEGKTVLDFAGVFT